MLYLFNKLTYIFLFLWQIYAVSITIRIVVSKSSVCVHNIGYFGKKFVMFPYPCWFNMVIAWFHAAGSHMEV